MWESLARTRRQDQVLHGSAKAVAVVGGVVMIPLWLAGQRVAGRVGRLLERRAQGTAALPLPPPGDRELDSVVRDLQAMPNRLRPSRTATQRKGLPDLWLFILTQKREAANVGYSYPSQFQYRDFESADGERIAASVATHDVPRPGLVVVHGLVSTRRMDYVRQIAVRAYYDWGFNVAAIDLRSFGVTQILTDAPNTGGWKEGEDVLEAARLLKSLGSTSVGAIGISLGSSSVMGASHLEGAPDLLDGGVLAVSGPADVHRAASYLDRKVPLTHPFYFMSLVYEAMLLSKVRNLGWPTEVADYTKLMELVVSPRYDVPVDEIYRRSSAVNHVHATRVPMLVLHAEDDDIVLVEHARMLEEAARGNENVRVWIVPGGGHAAFDMVDRRWTWTVYRTFFERLADYRERRAEEPAPAVAAVRA